MSDPAESPDRELVRSPAKEWVAQPDPSVPWCEDMNWLDYDYFTGKNPAAALTACAGLSWSSIEQGTPYSGQLLKFYDAQNAAYPFVGLAYNASYWFGQLANALEPLFPDALAADTPLHTAMHYQATFWSGQISLWCFDQDTLGDGWGTCTLPPGGYQFIPFTYAGRGRFKVQRFFATGFLAKGEIWDNNRVLGVRNLAWIGDTATTPNTWNEVPQPTDEGGAVGNFVFRYYGMTKAQWAAATGFTLS